MNITNNKTTTFNLDKDKEKIDVLKSILVEKIEFNIRNILSKFSPRVTFSSGMGVYSLNFPSEKPSAPNSIFISEKDPELAEGSDGCTIKEELLERTNATTSQISELSILLNDAIKHQIWMDSSKPRIYQHITEINPPLTFDEPEYFGYIFERGIIEPLTLEVSTRLVGNHHVAMQNIIACGHSYKKANLSDSLKAHLFNTLRECRFIEEGALKIGDIKISVSVEDLDTKALISGINALRNSLKVAPETAAMIYHHHVAQTHLDKYPMSAYGDKAEKILISLGVQKYSDMPRYIDRASLIFYLADKSITIPILISNNGTIDQAP